MPSIYVDNRGMLPKRKPHDLYPTQRALIRAGLPFALNYVYYMNAYRQRPFRILDLGAGDGRWGEAAASYFRQYFSQVELTGVEIRDVPKPAAFNYWHVGDALTWEPPAYRYDIVAGNPPFDVATELIYLAHKVSMGNVLFLLPRDFGGSSGRYAGLQIDHPVFVENVSARRPSFTGDNGTGGTVYSLWHWVADQGVPHQWMTRTFDWETDPADVDPVAMALRQIRQKAKRESKKPGALAYAALLASYYRCPPVQPDPATPEVMNRFQIELDALLNDLEETEHV